MTPEEFQHYFKSKVLVEFNWSALAEADWPIELRYFSLPEHAKHIYTPWYARADGSVCEFNDPQAKPQSVAEAALNNDLCVHKGVRDTPPPESVFVVPAYKLNNESILLLDGNHNAVSSQVAETRAAIAAFVVNGPLNKDILPDLLHWANPLTR